MVVVFRFLLFVMDQETPRSRLDAGAQSGNETQFVFSEGDIYPSDADIVRRHATGEFGVPHSFKLSMDNTFNR